MHHVFDLMVRGGTIVDGGGGEPFVGDVAISGDRIVAVGTVSGSASEEIDARGRLVTPGFVDIHTHYDAQAMWSDRLVPSSQHGVTTVVIGNCGVGFAPCRPADHEVLVSVMEGVEDIPGVVMTAGLKWNWETFPEYLDVLEAQPHDIDVAAYLPHSPLRVYAMGERGINREEPTPDELARIRSITLEALEAGALGFSTSRSKFHRTGQGEPIPSFDAGWAELSAVSDAFRRADKGIFQVVPDIDEAALPAELSMMEAFALASGRPVTFSLAQLNHAPEAWRDILQKIHTAKVQKGLQITAQVFPRPIAMILGLDATVNPFSLCPSYQELSKLPLHERVVRMRDREVRTRLLSETPVDPTTPIYRMARDFARMYPLQEISDYEPAPASSVLQRAKRADVRSEEMAYDMLLERDGLALLYSALGNYAYGTLDPVLEMMNHENSVIALGDGGAHYGVVCDASYTTFLLTYWTRDRRGARISVPQAIKSLSRSPAVSVGLEDRGLIAASYKADINIIDYDRLTLRLPYAVCDLPAGGRRLLQDAEGYVATIVSGKPIYRAGIPTGALPGQLVRGARKDPKYA